MLYSVYAFYHFSLKTTQANATLPLKMECVHKKGQRDGSHGARSTCSLGRTTVFCTGDWEDMAID